MDEFKLYFWVWSGIHIYWKWKNRSGKYADCNFSCDCGIRRNDSP